MAGILLENTGSDAEKEALARKLAAEEKKNATPGARSLPDGSWGGGRQSVLNASRTSVCSFLPSTPSLMLLPLAG